MRFLGVPLFTLLFLSAHAQHAAKKPAKPETAPPPPLIREPLRVPAAAASKTYRNPDLHFTYSYPGGFEDASALTKSMFDQQKAGASAEAKEQAACITVPLSVVQREDSGTSVLLVVTAGSACLHADFDEDTLTEFTRGEVAGMAESAPGAKFTEPQAYEIAGHKASMLSGSFPVGASETLHVVVACVLTSPDISCWQFMSAQQERLPAMAALPIQFDSGQQAAVVPASLLTETAKAK